MQNKLIINTVKCLTYIITFLILAFYSFTFNGCSGSDEDEVISQREKDSVEVYGKIQKAFGEYKQALNYNETSEDAKANAEFELSLKTLNEINYGLITKSDNYFWKKDYDELATSIVQDYFITQSEISESSLIFEFSKRTSVKYERVEEYTADREPLPDGSDVPLERNAAVDGYIEFFSNTERGKSFIDKSLYRSGKYFPIMRKILKYNNAPEELIYLSVQESGLNPTIVSRAGAVGMWQFMPATGNSYGLGSDSYRDDRRDFEKATDAAAHLLKDLYKTFDDWYLAFAAYNAGPGRVNKAIRNSGSRDFWTLRGSLPGETKNYVPSILALSFVLRNPEEYGFKDVEYGAQLTFDRVEIKSALTLQKVADLCETDIETIRDLNPELTGETLPEYDVPYEMRIPHKSFDKFLANFNSANDIDKSSGFTPSFAGNETAVAGNQLAGVQYKVSDYAPENARLIASTSGLKKVNHEYKKRESLDAVASYYDVRPTDIRIWNSMNYGINPKINQKLSIYLSDSKYNKLFGSNGIKGNLNAAEVIEGSKNKETENQNTSIVTTTAPLKTEPVKEEASDNNQAPVLIPSNDNNSSEQDNSAETVSGDTQDNISDNSVSETETSYSSSNETANENNSNGTEINSPEVKSAKKNSFSKTYTVADGDNLSKIAAENNVTVSELKEWNNLESDKIMSGQKLKINAPNVKTSVHTVSEGENLTMIANEYGISLSEIKELNDLKDDVIYPGQKLRVTESKTTGKTSAKETAVKKTFKVKKGDTLASIAVSNNVSVKEIKEWNNLKTDKVMIGQILKLYSDKKKK